MGVGKALFASGMVIWAFAATAFVASMVTQSWKLYPGADGRGFNYNLFKRCDQKNGSYYACCDYGWNPNRVPMEILATRITMIVAAAVILLATLVGLFGFSGDNRSIASEGMLTSAGAIVILVACGIFTGLTFQEYSVYGYSFYLAWISGGMFLLTGCLLCCAAYQNFEDCGDVEE